MREHLVAIGVSLFCLLGHCSADTFTHLQTGDCFHGFATQKKPGGKTLVYIEEKNSRKLINLADYKTYRDRHGRRNAVRIIPIKETIDCDAVTKALEETIVDESNKGPLAILIEIDSQSSDFGLVKRICTAITKTNNCDVIAFVCGGKLGGVFSAAAMIPIACDKIYMANTTCIGAGGIRSMLQAPKENNELQGEYVLAPVKGPDISSTGGYFKVLAQSKKRPAPLVLAMVKPNIGGLEIDKDGNKHFVERRYFEPRQPFVKSRNQMEALLTLGARDAVDCNVADCLVTSREDVIKDMNAAEAKIIVNNAMQKARVQLEKSRQNAKKLLLSIDSNERLAEALPSYPSRLWGKEARLEARRAISKKLAVLNTLVVDYEKAIKLAKNFPFLRLDLATLNSVLASVEASQEVLRQRRSEINRQLAEEERKEREMRRAAERNRPKERRRVHQRR